jgi:16S rRNA C1402 N4-methylase RsmH
MNKINPRSETLSLRSPPLTRIVPWSQQLACEVLQPGDLAVDLTAGKGRDALALAKAVGSSGQVVAFDLQPAAIKQTAEFLQSHDIPSKSWTEGRAVTKESGVFLVNACHSTLASVIQAPVKVVMANLGYLPGGDQAFITQPLSTLAALQCSLDLLTTGGRLAVTVYPAHQGGAEESAAVDNFFHDLPNEQWHVLTLRVVNCSEAPYLLIAERTS